MDTVRYSFRLDTCPDLSLSTSLLMYPVSSSLLTNRATVTGVKPYIVTAYGRIESSWQYEDGSFFIDVTVPVGTVCELVFPDGEKKELGSGRYVFTRALTV